METDFPFEPIKCKTLDHKTTRAALRVTRFIKVKVHLKHFLFLHSVFFLNNY